MGMRPTGGTPRPPAAVKGRRPMRKYVHDCMAELARELLAGLVRLKRGYIDAAEELIRLVEPRREYPFEFVVYRLTRFRPPAGDAPDRKSVV